MPFKMASLDIKTIGSLIYEMGANCFVLQGIDNNTLERSKQIFEEFSFQWIITSDCRDKDAFYMMFAYDPSKMSVLGKQHFDHPDSEQRFLFDTHMQVCLLHTPEDDQRYAIANIHSEINKRHNIIHAAQARI